MPMAIWPTLGVLALTVVDVFSIECLVKQTGVGLVSKKCLNDRTVGCRIRVLHNAIGFYDHTDDEPLICIVHSKNRTEKGCTKRTSGYTCWCYGSNCNDEDSSKILYENFLAKSQTESPTATTIKNSIRTADSGVTRSSHGYLIPKQTPKSHHHKKIHHSGGKIIVVSSVTSNKNFQSQTETKNHHIQSKSGKTVITKESEASEDISTTTVFTIHVTSKHEYENVIGSDAFKKGIGNKALPTDPPELDPVELSRRLEKEKYSSDEYSEDTFSDPPMSESDASVFLPDETRSPRIYTRSRDLDDAESVYYDGFSPSGSLSIAPCAAITSFLFYNLAQLL